MKKFASRVQKVKTDVVGLDVHKDVTVFSHLDPNGDECHGGSLASEGPVVLDMIRRVSEGRPVHVALEASGGMLWLYDLLVKEFGREWVHVAHPRKIRAIANSTEKNDANDAYWLAYYTSESRLPEAEMPTGVTRELRLAARARQEAVKLRSRASVLVKSYLRQMGERLPTVRLDAAAGLERARALASAAPGMLGAALKASLARFDAARAEVDAWDDAIAALGKDLPAVELLAKKVPGVGPTLAAVIAAESGPITRFASAKAYAKYTGMTPSDRSTGGRTIHGGMTREGSPYLRWALVQAVMACLRSSREAGSGARGAVARWVDAKQKRLGSKKKARVAAARKLATVIWWLFHRPEDFNAFRPFAGGAAIN